MKEYKHVRRSLAKNEMKKCCKENKKYNNERVLMVGYVMEIVLKIVISEHNIFCEWQFKCESVWFMPFIYKL